LVLVTFIGVALSAHGEPKYPIAPLAGRYQVVNGTPEMAKNIMLLDTWTGETWILCGPLNDLGQWCHMQSHGQP